MIAEQIFKLFKNAEKEAKLKLQRAKSGIKTTSTITTTTAKMSSIKSNDTDQSEHGREILNSQIQVDRLNRIYELFYSRFF